MSHQQGLRKTARRFLLLLGAIVTISAVSVGSAGAAQCDPAVDENCVQVVVTNDQLPPSNGYAVVYIDDRQFTPLLFFTALTAALTLAQFVWRASTGLRIGGIR